ncbi:hypothetical protein V8E36_004169, partial [Tilletia maclaganii]
MPPDRRTQKSAPEPKSKRNTKVECRCTVNGCKTDKRAFNMIAKRTRRYHQQAQRSHDELSRLRQEQSVLAPTHPLASSSQPAFVPAQSIKIPSIPPPPAARTPSPASAGFTPPPHQHAVLQEDFDMHDFGFGMDDGMYADGFEPGSPSPPSSSHSPRGDKDEAEDDNRDASDNEDDEAGSEFGDDVEQRPMLDPSRGTLAALDEGDDEEAGSLNDRGTSSRPQPLSAESSTSSDNQQRFMDAYSTVVRAYIVLVVLLTVYYGLGRQPANLLLAFFAKVVHPLLANDPRLPPLQLGTVRAQLGLTPTLITYAVCPECELLTLVDSAASTCPGCEADLYERPGKPKVVFAYQSLKQWLAWILQQPGIERSVQEWRDREPSDRLSDVFDGTFWQEEKDSNGRRFTDH